ncbi:hypothetical protein DRN86_00210 [Candidatus Geothermarchaeota archaeon]|nr:MAG: hypothetical protein DRN86_00210 [Candidatus Geothermarchaeota archaeon]
MLPLFKSKRGLSTIIGGIIMLSILFTVIFQLFSLFSIANALYHEATTDVINFDQEVIWELREVEVSCTYLGNEIFLNITNLSPMVVNILHLWIINESNNVPIEPQPMDVNITIPPGEITTFSLTLSVSPSEVLIKLVSGRGNVFVVEPEPISGLWFAYYGSGMGGGGRGEDNSSGNISWYPNAITVVIHDERPPGNEVWMYKIDIWNENNYSNTIYTSNIPGFGGISVIPVPDFGEYFLMVSFRRGNSNVYENLTESPIEVILGPDSPSFTIWIEVS